VRIESVDIRDEVEFHGFGSGCEAVLEREEELFVFSDEVCIAVAESMEVTGASESLPELRAVLFTHVMDEDDGHVELPLQLPEEAQESGDVSAGVFVGPVEPDERVEEQELRVESFNGISESCSIGFKVESERGGVDDVELQGMDVDFTMIADAENALSDHGRGVFGEINESGAAMLYGEIAETRSFRCNADGQIEPEPWKRPVNAGPMGRRWRNFKENR
jgi:hypothetical protein